MAPRIGKESQIPMDAGFRFLTGKPNRVAQLNRTGVLIIWGIDPKDGPSGPLREKSIELVLFDKSKEKLTGFVAAEEAGGRAAKAFSKRTVYFHSLIGEGSRL